MNYEAIVVGASLGGFDALKELLIFLKANFPIPIIIAQHLNPRSESYMHQYLNSVCQLKVKEIDEKETILPGIVYIAPPNYHILIEQDESFTLTVDEKVNYARPSIDVLFESAAEVYKEKLIGIILTGANKDGSNGLKRIKENGGIAIVQEPSCAEADTMPRSAINAVDVDYILPIKDIAILLNKILGEKHIC